MLVASKLTYDVPNVPNTYFLSNLRVSLANSGSFYSAIVTCLAGIRHLFRSSVGTHISVSDYPTNRKLGRGIAESFAGVPALVAGRKNSEACK